MSHYELPYAAHLNVTADSYRQASTQLLADAQAQLAAVLTAIEASPVDFYAAGSALENAQRFLERGALALYHYAGLEECGGSG